MSNSNLYHLVDHLIFCVAFNFELFCMQSELPDANLFGNHVLQEEEEEVSTTSMLWVWYEMRAKFRPILLKHSLPSQSHQTSSSVLPHVHNPFQPLLKWQWLPKTRDTTSKINANILSTFNQILIHCDEKKVSANLYQKCLILCRKILLHVLMIKSCTQHKITKNYVIRLGRLEKSKLPWEPNFFCSSRCVAYRTITLPTFNGLC